MRSRRGATTLCGILPVDKPAGLTSHDVVQRVRSATGERRVGHAGTLDPAATGLLVVLVGPATRLARFVQAGAKTYDALVAFGVETDTADADGEPVRTADVPDEVLDPAFASRTIASLVGSGTQVPPAHSAVKVRGRKAYDLARAGEDPGLAPRPVTIESADLVAVESVPGPAWRVSLRVSKGTYVRSIARDLGPAAGTVSHLASLRRTASGTLTLADAHPLEAVAESEDAAALFVPASRAMGLATLQVDDETARRVADGRALPLPADGLPGPFVALIRDARTVAVYAAGEDGLVPEVVIPGGCP